jgi:signal transduction histidine kinase
MTALQTQAVNGHAASFEHLREGNELRVAYEARAAHEVEARTSQAQQRHLMMLTTAGNSLRGPLEPIRRAAALLEHAHGDRSLLSRLQHIIESQLALLSTLIDDVHDGAGANAREASNQRGTVDLIDLLCLAVAWSRSTLATRNQVLTREAPRGAPRVRGDAVRLRQAFSRLLEHASAQVALGGEITLLTQENTETVAVTVADSEFAPGPQAPCDSVAAQPHKQGPATALDEVRELMRAYGGSVAVSSSGNGRYSAFVVTLPKA